MISYEAVGVGLIIMVIGIVLMGIGAFSDIEILFPIGIVLTIGPFLIGLVIWGLQMISGQYTGPQYREGACYKAVSVASTTYVMSGKVLVPVTSSSLKMMEIDCP